jgi:hypothetical protein
MTAFTDECAVGGEKGQGALNFFPEGGSIMGKKGEGAGQPAPGVGRPGHWLCKQLWNKPNGVALVGATPREKNYQSIAVIFPQVPRATEPAAP